MCRQGGDLRQALSNDVDGALGWYLRGHRVALDIARGLHFLHARDVRALLFTATARLPMLTVFLSSASRLGSVASGSAETPFVDSITLRQQRLGTVHLPAMHG